MPAERPRTLPAIPAHGQEQRGAPLTEARLSRAPPLLTHDGRLAARPGQCLAALASNCRGRDVAVPLPNKQRRWQSGTAISQWETAARWRAVRTQRRPPLPAAVARNAQASVDGGRDGPKPIQRSARRGSLTSPFLATAASWSPCPVSSLSGDERARGSERFPH